MNRSHKVKATKIHQEHAGTKQSRAGKTYRGANYVAQKTESTKKNTARAAAARKTTKK